MYMKQQKDTSWQPVSKWYNKLVDEKGHYFHQHVVIPGVLRLLSLDLGSRLLDVACGQGILGRSIPRGIPYTGFDIAPSLIAEAKKLDTDPVHTYLVGDATKPLPLGKWSFTHAAIVLALQNIENAEAVIEHTQAHLTAGGTFVLVLNHPSFRIPRQSSWGVDEGNKLQYRRENIYMSPLKIPITMHPGDSNSEMTWSFHHPISYYVALLTKRGFVIDALEEWTSDKESEGKASRMENKARSEFPLFLALRVRKNH
jgi:ubiquinone/menaquinone biosynthesis C-methylase UbiE